MLIENDVLSLEQTKRAVDSYLDTYLEKQLQLAESIDPSYGHLLETIRQYVAGGGKRLRPYLFAIAHHGYGGSESEDSVAMACAWELLHTALLVHDDIIDRDDVRHWAPNIAGRYQDLYKTYSHKDSEHYAMSSALLAGDLLISMSQKIVLSSGLSADKKLSILELLNLAIFDVGGGELIDTETALKSIDSTDARKIARFKTASYTFELPLVSGALLADADPSELELLQKLGNKLGIAFQIIDDVLGVFGASVATGKSVDSDIYERKHTVLVQEAYKLLSGQERDELVEFYSLDTKLSESDVERVRQILSESGAKDAVMEEARQLTYEAESLINQLNMNDPAKNTLLQLVEVLLKRNA